MFIFTKEIAKKLAHFRMKNKMSQKEVAERMGMKPKSGQSYIAQLERRKIKNPFLSTVLNYLDAVGILRPMRTGHDSLVVVSCFNRRQSL